MLMKKYSLGLLYGVLLQKQNRISLNEGNVVGCDMNESKAFRPSCKWNL